MHPRVTSVADSKKKLKKTKIKEMPYTSRIWLAVPIRPIGTNFGLRVRVVDIIDCAKFYCNRLRGLDSLMGRNLTILIGLRCRR